MIKDIAKTTFCDFPKTSSLIDDLTTSCLKKFTIHFRRPATIKQKNNAPYQGQYGFDWLRDEYIYPIEFVDLKEDQFRNLIYIKKYTPLCQQPYFLKKEYLKDVKNPIKPYNKDYYPAWLAIYACNIEGNANSSMHNKGVDLNLQLDEIDSINDDGTEIILKPGKSCLKVNPTQIPISKFIAQGKKTRILDQYSKEKVNYYEIENAVNVICQGGTLDTHEEIKVFAKLGDTEIEVGKLMVYQNNIIPKLKINLVSVILEKDEKGNKIRPDYVKSINSLLSNKTFNQALIKPEITSIEEFDMLKFSEENPQNSKLKSFLDNVKNKALMSKKVSKNKSPDKYVFFRIIHYYKVYKEILNSFNEKQSNPQNHIVTLFFVTVNPLNGRIGGLTIKDFKEINHKGIIIEEKMLYHGYSIYFQNSLKDNCTIQHELGHSLTLHHIFEKQVSSPPITERLFNQFELNNFNIYSEVTNDFVFYQGYTENIMDYSFKRVSIKIEKNYVLSNSDDNKYRGNRYSFFKWQWDLMRNSPVLVY
ncbi:hypothetical protein GYM75_09205 [Gilliamella sp. ESL0441]|uniref:hypothetical protein n=1 Tax=Gilliamella sp. ESL0441 TaxID=2704654 RepID=UPI001C6A4E14|nr:hypothetical protein [Gilliamella sp. ESL0441]QYN45005.1 hypothetical protein GYM75_09205 [Gilliamella sp. ESL0441]